MSSHYRAGDILAFYGCDFVSRGIEFVTGRPSILPPFWINGPSHVAIIAKNPDGESLLANAIWEATTLCSLNDLITKKPKQGVQTHEILDRIDRYPGQVYHYAIRPRWQLDHYQDTLLYKFLMHCRRDIYDYRGAGLSGTRILKFWLNFYPNESAMFCSELCCTALQRIGLYADINPSSVNPANLVTHLRSSGKYEAPRLCQVRNSL